MKSGNIFLILICVGGIAAGQVLFKLTAQYMARTGGDGFSVWRYANAYFVFAIFIYATTTLLWVWVLRSVPLNVAYPFMALAFFIVPVMSWFFLGEDLGVRHLFGNLLIISGILVIAHGG
ncbi:MAG: EamA family transporter [Desulfuromonadales bacterium]